MSRNCERCGANPGANALALHDYCIHCSENLCGECMEAGKCDESLTGDHCPEPDDDDSALGEAMSEDDNQEDWR
jgi:hypothetical protein